MPIYVGPNEVPAGALQVGGTPVTAVYVGATQVWPPADTLPAGNVLATESGDALATETGLGVLATENQPTGPGNAHDHFNSFASDPGLQVYESLRSTQSILDSAQVPGQVADYWSYNSTIQAAEARMGPEYVSTTPTIPAAGHFVWQWTPIDYVTDPGTWVSFQFELRYSNAFFVDTNLYLGGFNVVEKVCNIRDGAGVNVNGVKTRGNFGVGPQYVAEKMHEIYYRMHKDFNDALRAGENIAAQQEPFACEDDMYPTQPPFLTRRNNLPGLFETLLIDQDRDEYERANTWTGFNTPAFLLNDEWIQYTVHHYYGGPTDQRIRVDAATETAGPFKMLDTETFTAGDGINRYPDPADPAVYACGEMIVEFDSSQKGTGIDLNMAQWATLDLGDGLDYSRGVRIDLRNVIVRKAATRLPTVRPIRVEP